MKKTLAVGIVAVAFATVPALGAFAATEITDTINVTVSTTCEITSPAGGATKSASLGMSAVNANIGSTSITVKCNAAKGYTVKVATTALTNQTSSSYTIPYSTTTPVAGTAAWTVTKGESTDTTNLSSGGTVMSTTAADASASGATQKVTYKASTSATQAAGTYKGTAKYTLTQNT